MTMDEPDVFELFRRHVKIETELSVDSPVYGNFPARVPKRKKRRLHKKWLARYGTIKKRIGITQRPILNVYDLRRDEYGENITMRMTARSQPVRAAVSDINPISMLENSHPSTSVPYSITTYEFPSVGAMQIVSPEFLAEYQRDPQLLKVTHDVFFRQVETIVRRETKINNVSSWGPLSDDIIEDKLDAEFLA